MKRRSRSQIWVVHASSAQPARVRLSVWCHANAALPVAVRSARVRSPAYHPLLASASVTSYRDAMSDQTPSRRNTVSVLCRNPAREGSRSVGHRDDNTISETYAQSR